MCVSPACDLPRKNVGVVVLGPNSPSRCDTCRGSAPPHFVAPLVEDACLHAHTLPVASMLRGLCRCKAEISTSVQRRQHECLCCSISAAFERDRFALGRPQPCDPP